MFVDRQLGRELFFAAATLATALLLAGQLGCLPILLVRSAPTWGIYFWVGVLSAALVRTVDSVSAKALINDVNNDQRLNMNALSEREYYDLQTRSAAPIEFTGVFVAIIMAVGSSFAAMNTMYAAVARRAQEIGTLRARELRWNGSNNWCRLSEARASMLRPYKVEEGDKDKRARASLHFWARVFMTVGRIATFMPSAAIAVDWDLSTGSMTKVPVKSA